MSEDEVATRESPLLYDGGLRFGPPTAHMQGVIWRGHPPLECPAPRIDPGIRGYYRCPACAAKVRLAGDRTAREVGYEMADRGMSALAEALWAALEVLRIRPREAENAREWVYCECPCPSCSGCSGAVSEAKECQVCDD